MGVASGCGEQEVGVASGSGWNLWVWLLGVVLRYRFPHTTYPLLLLYLYFFCSSIPTFLFIKKKNSRSCMYIDLTPSVEKIQPFIFNRFAREYWGKIAFEIVLLQLKI